MVDRIGVSKIKWMFETRINLGNPKTPRHPPSLKLWRTMLQARGFHGDI